MTRPVHGRRAVLGGLAAGGLALPLLSACGSTSPSPTLEGPIPTGKVPEGEGVIATFGNEHVVVTQPSAGDFRCFSAVCTHQGCLVNRVADGIIHCPCHGSEFSVEDGSVVGGPAPRPLPDLTSKLHVKGGEIRFG